MTGVNAQRRQAAIEAGARALDLMAWDPDPWDNLYGKQEDRQRKARREAADVIDAALPHLVGEPAGHATYSALTGRLSIDLSVKTTRASVRYALIPVDEP